MKQETIEQLMREADKQFRLLGLKDFESGRKYSIEKLEKFLSLLKEKNFKEMLVNWPEPSPDELYQWLEVMRQTVGRLRKSMRSFIKKKISHPPGGRDSVLGSPSKQQERIQMVLTLIGKRAKTTEALKRVAHKEGISLSSMQRIWRKRGNLTESQSKATTKKDRDSHNSK